MLPLYVDITAKKIVVFGAGDVAERKIRQILDTCSAEGKADIEVYSHDFTPGIEELRAKKELTCFRCDLWSTDLSEMLKDAFLVLICTTDEALNTRILNEAAKFDALVNYKHEGDVFMASVINKGGFLVSISTGGKGPAMAKYLRETLSQQFIGDKEEKMLLIQAKLRGDLKEMVKEEKRRHEILNLVLRDPECWAALDAPVEIAEKHIVRIIGNRYE